MPITFPGESPDYRSARDALLQAELELRAKAEDVARLRQALPDGRVVEDYEFTDLSGRPVRLSELFRDGQDTLGIYSLMYAPDAAAPCPMCVSMLDGLQGQAKHIEQRMSLAVVAMATPDMLRELAKVRGWNDLRLYSAGNTRYQRDYHAETGDGAQLPMLNIFTRRSGEIRHFWASEGFFAEVDGQARHVDQIWPLWNMFDLTPAGRGEDWYPALDYAS